MKVLVTGGRDFSSYEARMWLYDGLNLLHGMKPITEIIEGGARGADCCAKNWALWRQSCGDQVKLTTVDADWGTHGKSAGCIRNVDMANMRPDVVLACPGGRGTAHMVRVAVEQGLRVVLLEKMPVSQPKERGPVAEPPVVVVEVAATPVPSPARSSAAS